MGDICDNVNVASTKLEHFAHLEEKGLISSTGSHGESCVFSSDHCSENICDSDPKGLSAGNNVSTSTGETKHSPLKVGKKPLIASVYRSDVVQSRSEEGVFGMVTRVAGDSDSSDYDNEEEDDVESISGDHARVVWSNLVETTEKLEDLIVVDRSFMHGDIVASISDPKGQTGTVVSIDLFVDLKMPSGEIKIDVPSRKLKRIKAFTEEDYVLRDSWLGRVDEVVDNVTVLFDDGSKCKVMRADPECLMSVSKNVFEDTIFPYYPGQRVRGTSSVVFKSARWLRGTWKASRMEGTVSNVEAGSVYVYWIAPPSPASTISSTNVPANMQDPKHLKLLSCFSYANWQLADWCFLPTSGRKLGITFPVKQDALPDKDTELTTDCDTLPSFDSSSPTTSGSVQNGTIPAQDCCKRRVKRDKKLPKKDDVFESALLIVNTKTKVDVLWQDGTKSFGVDSKVLFAVYNLGEHDFRPEQYVLEKGSDEDGEDSQTRRVGVVKTMDSKERTALVRWQKTVSRPQDPREFDNEEIVSVYDLVGHPDYNYFIGDIVIRLPPVEEVSQASDAVKMSVDEKECEIEANIDKDCEIELKCGECVKSDPSSEERSLKKRQKTDLGFDFEDHIGDDKEIDFQTKCVSDTKSMDASLQQGASRRCRKAKVDAKVEDMDFSWIGNIIGVRDGEIEVMWADGTVTKVGPQSIFVVGRDDDMESTQSSFDENDNDDAASWETVDDNMMATFDADEQQLEQSVEPAMDQATDAAHASNENLHKISDTNTSVLRAFGFVARLATGFLGFRGSKNSSDTLDPSSQEQAMQKHGIAKNTDRTEASGIEGDQLTRDLNCHLEPGGDSIHIKDGLTSLPATADLGDKMDSECGDHNNVEGTQDGQDQTKVSTEDDLTRSIPIDIKQNLQEMNSLPISINDGQNLFKHFDSVQDPADHYFFNETAQNCNDRKWSKKVQQEWSLLEKNLPESIYVRVYEDRIDLLRAVIIGASGTPYQDGLFFFDIYLPSKYPQAPPAVYYHSRGLRLNPNLYETGKVCLSLLNTWIGRGNEIWDPTSSSILQVLVSLQGLVLNARPYFNEAGYDKQVGTAEGEKNSLAYNENSFLLTCKLMLYLLHRPPQHFENFIKDHFRRRGHSILCACGAFMNGAEVGSLSEVPLKSGQVSQNNSSVGFRFMLDKIIPKLKSAFDELALDCNNYFSNH
ncbi:probable ubiquitin-conjugating enzyme E2 23, partial [Cryptomeria japonica]|uniref:probable ubiquitin-conjugating enzyme E2 23 n=1 Tax=Cryptomeria japonica TaxID=3369 RepID=UPI0027DA85A7